MKEAQDIFFIYYTDIIIFYRQYFYLLFLRCVVPLSSSPELQNLPHLWSIMLCLMLNDILWYDLYFILNI